MHEIHFTIHPNAPTQRILPTRNYSNLRSISFTSELLDENSYQSKQICTDLETISSTSILNNVKRIYLYDHVYPKEFRTFFSEDKHFFFFQQMKFFEILVAELMKLLPNVQSLRLCVSALNLSDICTRVTSLTIDFNARFQYKTYNALEQIGRFLPNIHYLYIEIANTNEIFVVLTYFLRKLTHLLDIHVTLQEAGAQFDQTNILLWFDEFKIFNLLNNRVQMEFGYENNRLHISL